MTTQGNGPGGRKDRFRGALLGTLVGDALGMPVEGWPAERIRRELGEVREMLPARRGAGTFTDDTQMTAALARAFVEMDNAGEPDPGVIARHFGASFDPSRGYGGNTARILAELQAGGNWRDVVERHRLPGGSFANGAAMRVAPVALAAFPDSALAARLAEVQTAPTGHDHPEARFGARLQAVAVLECLVRGTGEPPPDVPALQEAALEGWEGKAPGAFAEALAWVHRNRRAPLQEAARALRPDVRAATSVPAALWAFLSFPDDPEEAIVTAVGLGGDTDTVGAMAGALVGARNGASAFPPRWVEAVEDGPDGRTGLMELADRLHARV